MNTYRKWIADDFNEPDSWASPLEVDHISSSSRAKEREKGKGKHRDKDPSTDKDKGKRSAIRARRKHISYTIFDREKRSINIDNILSH